MTISRREFIEVTAGTAVVAASSAFAQQSGKNRSKSEVFVGKGDAAQVLPKILEKMGGLSRFVKQGSRVMIKPNMSFANPPEWGTSTSPEAVFTMAKMCIEAGAKKVIVCDNTIRDPEHCREKTGIEKAIMNLKEASVFIPRQDNMFIQKTDPRAKELTRVDIVKEVYQCDCIISLPTAKSHSAAGISMNVKGLMGLVKDRYSYHRDMELHTALAEQLYYITPHLNIVDTTRALLDNGPAGPGKVAELNTFVAGIDPVAVDSYTVSLTPWYGKTLEGKQVKHLKIADELNLGNVDSSMISETMV